MKKTSMGRKDSPREYFDKAFSVLGDDDVICSELKTEEGYSAADIYPS